MADGHPTSGVPAHGLEVALDALSAQLGDTARHIESAVSRVCASFASIARRTKDGAAHAARAAGPGGPEGEDAQATARTTIADLLARMDRVQRATEEAVQVLGRLEGISNRVNQVQRSLDNVDAVAYALRILALNSRIEAARAGQHGKGFAVVAAETGRQAEVIGGMAATVRGLVNGLWDEVQSSTRRMRAGLVHDDAAGDLSRVARQSREEGERALAALARAQDEMRETVREAAANAAQVAADIEDAMTALQFQDAVNQQLDHAAAGLREVRDALASGDPARAAGLLGRLRARATMRSERRVLDGFAADPPAADAPPGSIELF